MKKRFLCTACGHIHEGEELPEECPICEGEASRFVELTY